MSHSTKPQYFLAYAVLGSITPVLSVLLAGRGLTPQQIGDVQAFSSMGVILTPLLITLLADTAIAPRYLMGGLFGMAGISVGLMIQAYSYWPLMVLYTVHSLALFAIFPLQDGIHFAAQAIRIRDGQAEVPYHAVRVWGTFGYILPGAILYFFLKPGTLVEGKGMSPALACGALFCGVGLAYAFFLPHTPPPVRSEAHSRLPTAAAARVLCRPRVLLFCLAMLLIHLASAFYYFGYPLHLTQRSGIDKRYLGVIANIGVIGEIFFMLAFAAIVRRISLRNVMLVGAFCVAARLFILARFAQADVAIATQLIHGLTVLALHVAPPSYLNSLADNHYRNSIQGLYTMLFSGAGRAIGFKLAGNISQQKSLQAAFTTACVIAAVGFVLFCFAFAKPLPRETRRPEA